MKLLVQALLVVGALQLGACGKREAPAQDAAPKTPYGRVDQSRVVATNSEPQHWFTTGRTFSEERCSPLDQINVANAQQLGFAWQYDLQTERGLEATPVIVIRTCCVCRRASTRSSMRSCYAAHWRAAAWRTSRMRSAQPMLMRFTPI
jgi:glucose dehydrogenase